MIIMRIQGGLGNQLFQYAAGYALAKKNGCPLLLSPDASIGTTASSYKLPLLQLHLLEKTSYKLPLLVRCITNNYVRHSRIFGHLYQVVQGYPIKDRKNIYFFEDEMIDLPNLTVTLGKKLYLDGYFQRENLFNAYRKELCSQFQPNYTAEPIYQQTLQEIVACNSVAVHVRWGDFQKCKHPFHYLLTRKYYQQAIDYIAQRVPNPTFFWFSDDIPWVKEHYGKIANSKFIQLKTTYADIDELMLMKHCKHIITANSTYSWWGAWLNENPQALRIVPEKIYGPRDMIPTQWIKIPVE